VATLKHDMMTSKSYKFFVNTEIENYDSTEKVVDKTKNNEFVNVGCH